MADSFNKKDKEKKKQQQRKEKEQRKADRKANAKSGQSLEDMMAYVDENGNISSTPPDPLKKRVINESDIVLGSRNIGGVENRRARTGRITRFDQSKGYGFIKDSDTAESIFVHVNSMDFHPKEGDVVTYEVMDGPKGLSANNVKKA